VAHARQRSADQRGPRRAARRGCRSAATGGDGVALQLADVLRPEVLDKARAFRFFRQLLNYTPWKAAHAPFKYDTHLDFYAADSSVACYRDHLLMDDTRIRVLTMKEPPAQSFAHVLEDLTQCPSPFIACLEWQRRPVSAVRREIHARRRHFFNRRVSLVNYVNPQARPEEMLVDDSASATVRELGESLTAMDVHGHVCGACSFTLVLHDTDPARLERSVATCAKVFAAHDGVVHDERYNLLNAWLAVLPGNTAHNLRRLTLFNTTAADLALLFTVETGIGTSGHLGGRNTWPPSRPVSTRRTSGTCTARTSGTR
jgi:type IV secretion system protein TrbE